MILQKQKANDVAACRSLPEMINNRFPKQEFASFLVVNMMAEYVLKSL